MFIPALELITGPMFSGKSDELIRRLTLCRIAQFNVIVFKPESDTRQKDIFSRNGGMMSAIAVSSSAEILPFVDTRQEVIGFDEVQFFDIGLVDVVRTLLRSGKRIVASGLNLDYQENPFETTAALMTLASEVIMLKAVCDKCHSFEAVRSQRINKEEGRILVGDKEYSPRCLRCFNPPE